MAGQVCLVESCETAGRLTRGMCAKHYRAWLEKTPLDERPLAPRFARDFWQFVDRTGDCWIWTGPTNRQGYGLWSGGGERGLAHRIALAREVPIPDASLMACHHCDTPPCVNPAHLYWGTAADNARDLVERIGVHNKGKHPEKCKRGHALAGDNVRIVGKDKRWMCRECDNMRSRERQRRVREARRAA